MESFWEAEAVYLALLKSKILLDCVIRITNQDSFTVMVPGVPHVTQKGIHGHPIDSLSHSFCSSPCVSAKKSRLSEIDVWFYFLWLLVFAQCRVIITTG